MADVVTPVVLSSAKKTIAMIVALVMTLGGSAILVCAYLFEWGFLVWFWVGLITLFGAIGFVSTVVQKSQFASAACPACGHTMTFIGPDDHRIIACEACHAWSEGTDAMRLVPDDYVAERAVFTVPVKKDQPIAWVRNEQGEPQCTMCGQSAPMKRDEAQSYSMGAALGMGGTITTWSTDVPKCEHHPDAVVLVSLPGEGPAAAFRSRAASMAFAALNAAGAD